MNKNILIVLGGGVLIAVLVAVLVEASLKGNKPPVEVKEEAKVEVLVAAKDLKAGTDLKAEDLRWQNWPKSAVFPGAIVRKEQEQPLDVISGRLARAHSVDEPVMKSSILKTEGNYLAAVLPRGMRAIAIGVKADSQVGGFVQPGDHVDIILTYKTKIDAFDKETQQEIKRNIDELATETILENIKVLAVDQAATKAEDKIKVGKTVTLEVSPHDAEKLALSGEMGQLILALRGVGDEDKITARWPVMTDMRVVSLVSEIYSMSDKLHGQASAAPIPWPVPMSSANSSGVNENIVRIYNGSVVQDLPSR